MRSHLLRFLTFCCCLFITSASYAQDYLFQFTAPIARHHRKMSSHTFASDAGKSALILFQPSVRDSMPLLDQQALLYDMPPSCAEVGPDGNTTVLDELHVHSEGTDKFDVVIYPLHSSFKIQPGFSGVSVPWDPMYDVQAGHDTVDARMQDLIRALNPKCLPARFRFVYADSQRFQEIRYGNTIWKK